MEMESKGFSQARRIKNESLSLADLELWQGVHEGSAERVKGALKDGANPSGTDERGEGVLARAARMLRGAEGSEPARWAVMRTLLEAGSDPNSADARGRSALSHVAMAGHEEALAALLEAGASADSSCCQGFSPLHWAASEGRVEAAKRLLLGGAPANAKNSFGETALWLATVRGQREIATELLRAGADPMVILGNLESWRLSCGSLSWEQALGPELAAAAARAELDEATKIDGAGEGKRRQGL